MAQSEKMDGRPSPYAPASVPRKCRAVPPSSLARRSVEGPYSLSIAPSASPPKEPPAKQPGEPEA